MLGRTSGVSDSISKGSEPSARVVRPEASVVRPEASVVRAEAASPAGFGC